MSSHEAPADRWRWRSGWAIWVAAFAVRILPTVVGGGPRAVLEYDDGVYYSAAHDLVFGPHLYSSQVFVHPPGIAYLLSPAAVLGSALGEGVGMVLARALVAAIASTTAWLIFRQLRSRSLTTAALIALVYAVWQPVVMAERTAMLEPVLTLLTVLAVMLVSAGRPLASGAVVGLALVVKVWAVALIAVFLVRFVVVRAPTAALRWCVGCFAASGALLVPFLVAEPSDLFREVVLDQAARPSDGDTMWDRLQMLSGWTFNHRVMDLTTVHGAGLVGLGFLVAGLVLGASYGPTRLWAAVAAGYAIELGVGPSFGYHYPEILVAPLLICLGTALARLELRTSRLVLVGASVLAGMLALTLTAPGADAMPTGAVSILREARCPWIPSRSAAIAADATHHDCGERLDYFGLALDLTRSSTGPTIVDRARSSGSFQQLIRTDFSHADVALIGRTERGLWSDTTIGAFDKQFHLVRSVPGFDLYLARERTAP